VKPFDILAPAQRGSGAEERRTELAERGVLAAGRWHAGKAKIVEPADMGSRRHRTFSVPAARRYLAGLAGLARKHADPDQGRAARVGVCEEEPKEKAMKPAREALRLELGGGERDPRRRCRSCPVGGAGRGSTPGRASSMSAAAMVISLSLCGGAARG
jgi:hypothetical protein